MPNWVTNIIHVTGEQSVVEDFLGQADSYHDHFVPDPRGSGGRWETSTGLLWAFVPPPESIRTESEYFALNESDCSDKANHWYKWNVDHWGTKWDVTNASLDILDTNPAEYLARLSFETAWDAPIPVLKAMSEQYPTLDFSLEWWEEGAGVQGEVNAHGGKVTSSLVGATDHAWYLEKYGTCQDLWLHEDESGWTCPECGETVPLTPAEIFGI
jgi:hypothetical protein